MTPSVTLPNIIPDLTDSVNGIVTQGLEAVGVVFPAIVVITGAVVVWQLGIRLIRKGASA